MLGKALLNCRLLARSPCALSTALRCASSGSRSATGSAKRSRSGHATRSDPQKAQSPVPPPAHWSPTPAEYEALIADLLLYRRESVGPMIDALQKERAQLDASVQRMEQRIAEMYSIREEIRTMIQSAAASQRAALLEALREMGGSDETDQVETRAQRGEESSEDEEIAL